jgi:hypothetical protein
MKVVLAAAVLFVAATVVADDSISVNVVGSLRTGVVAVGAETTGTTITSKGITWELDVGDNAEFRKAVENLNGKKVNVEGMLERRAGVEVKERWIVKVAKLRAVEAK